MSQSSEIELCYYALVSKPDGLRQATDIEDHEQWEYKAKNSQGEYQGKVRVRATKRQDGVVYEECLKVPTQSDQSLQNTEYTIPITEEYFRAWIALFGEKGTLKTRYTFLSQNVTLQMGDTSVALPVVKFEVDILKDHEGRSSKWCKIDIEIDHLLEILEQKGLKPGQVELSVALSKLPFEPQTPISAVTTDPEQRKAIDAFWERFSHKKAT